MWRRTKDGSVIDRAGKIIFFSVDRFVRDICLGSCCFICGARPDEKPFNDEHILPRWLLRRYDLFSKAITLPNEKLVRYGSYTISCCTDCNALMGDEVEAPISRALAGGPDALAEFIIRGNALKIFVWMGLIYLKTHLKDTTLRFYLDQREGSRKIGELYAWEHLHHIHCVVRCFYTGCEVHREAIGSFLSIPVRSVISKDRFDFSDLFLPQTMLLQLGDTGMVAVFNDSGGAMSLFAQKLDRITGPVTELQLREIMVDLAVLNMHLKERPVFRTLMNVEEEKSWIIAERPALHLEDFDPILRGSLMHYVMRDRIPHISVQGLASEEIESAMMEGLFTFLFDEDGNFLQDPASAS